MRQVAKPRNAHQNEAFLMRQLLLIPRPGVFYFRVGVWVCGCVGVWVCGCVYAGVCVCLCLYTVFLQGNKRQNDELAHNLTFKTAKIRVY